MHGVGAGGGSLVYACTLPTPGKSFFMAPSWRHLADWEQELAPRFADKVDGGCMSMAPEGNQGPEHALLATS